MKPLSRFALEAYPPLILERAGIVPDPWQAAVLDERAPQTLLNCSRQAGKSTTVAGMALQEARYCADPGLVLILSPSLRQSRLALKSVKKHYAAIEGIDPEDEEHTATVMDFGDGGHIEALPGTEASIRGFSKVKLLIVDEAARVADDLYRSIRPMLAVSKGRIVLLSTPFGKRGFFFDEWSKGENWKRVQIPADQCPRISLEFLAAERKSLPEAWYLQEYFCKFADAEGSAFSYDDIMKALRDDVEPLFPAEGIATDDVAPLFG